MKAVIVYEMVDHIFGVSIFMDEVEAKVFVDGAKAADKQEQFTFKVVDVAYKTDLMDAIRSEG